MADWAKIFLKAGLIAGVMVGLWAVFTQIQIPAIDYTVVTQTAGTAMAFLTYWCPAFPIIWNISLVCSPFAMEVKVCPKSSVVF